MNLVWRARPTLQQVWAHLFQASGCLWWVKRQLRRRGAVMVLTFHRVLNDAEFQRTCSLPGIVVRRRTFENLAEYVAGKYEAVDFAQAIEAAAGKMRVMFTFDDGWKDNYTNALPVMRTRGIPATVFLCPGLVGRTLPFWPERWSYLQVCGYMWIIAGLVAHARKVEEADPPESAVADDVETPLPDDAVLA